MLDKNPPKIGNLRKSFQFSNVRDDLHIFIFSMLLLKNENYHLGMGTNLVFFFKVGGI